MVMGPLLTLFTGMVFLEESVSNKFAILSINTSRHVTDEKYSNSDHVIDQVVNTILPD